MKAKFTSGEWMVHLPTTRDGRLMVLHPDGERVLAKLDEGYVSGRGALLVEERIANANLMAAAPRLYRALEAVVRIADRDTDVFADARAALAQAEGGG